MLNSETNLSVISVENLNKSYGGSTAIDHLNFSVEKGAIHGFLGPNGAGKSTTLNIIAGILRQSSGVVKTQGEIGYLPENLPLYRKMLVTEYLLFVGSLRGLSGTELASQVEEVLNKCGLKSVENRLIANLSKGFCQRIGVAQALMGNPKILILDEPTVGLDPHSLVEMRELMLTLKKDHTILFSSHQLSEVQLLCDELTIINRGKVVATGKRHVIEEKFTTTHVLQASTSEMNDDLIKSLENTFNGNFKLVKKESGLVEWKLSLKKNAKQTSDLTKWLVEKDVKVFQMQQLGLSLEEIFEGLTQKAGGL
jgi:ABC-2 type transport system ATP-binding protein